MSKEIDYQNDLYDDPRFKRALLLFNSADWYPAHDAFEEIWHETTGPERKTIQGFLQIAVAQLHLERGNKAGATILYGESLGRLKTLGAPDLGIDIEALCICVEDRLRKLQINSDLDACSIPKLKKRYMGTT